MTWRRSGRTLDEPTLQLDLIHPAAYLHTVAYTWVFYPVKAAIVNADPDTWWRDRGSAESDRLQ
jgi:hypothetical protein